MSAPGGDEVDDMILQARAYLLHVAEPPAPALHGFVAEHGPCRAAERIQSGHVPRDVANEVEPRRERCDGEQDLHNARLRGAELLVPESPDWPGRMFAALGAASAAGRADIVEPLALWHRNAQEGSRHSLDGLTQRSITLVGARAASGYGEQVATEFGQHMARQGVTVVSGAAHGIDGMTHRGALGVSGATVAVLACGVDIDYPAGHARLLDAVARHGMVLSEYPPGTPPRRHRFLVRNRLLAALGHGTVVVEAGRRSGAGNTAGTADALGRPVLAVPGPVTSATSMGCHSMIRSGLAVLATRPEEAIEAISPLGQATVTEPSAPDRDTDGLDRWAVRVYEALDPCTGTSVEEIAREAGIPARRVRAMLPALATAGLAQQCGGEWLRVPR